MNAVILAAGVARRLAPFTDRTPKCLLPVGDRPLVVRMLEALASVGVRETVLVVGHCADQVRAVAGEAWGAMRIRYVDNPEYRRGSALSLYAARAHLGAPTLVMDADVLFPRELLRRLVAAAAPTACLIDRSFEDTGEEVKYYTRGDRVVALGKKIVPASWEQVGEGVGFFRCDGEAGRELVTLLEQVLREGDGLNEYEDALHLLAGRRPVGWIDVTGLPWTEIDFPEDLHRARTEVLPHIVKLDGG